MVTHELWTSPFIVYFTLKQRQLQKIIASSMWQQCHSHLIIKGNKIKIKHTAHCGVFSLFVKKIKIKKRQKVSARVYVSYKSVGLFEPKVAKLQNK